MKTTLIIFFLLSAFTFVLGQKEVALTNIHTGEVQFAGFSLLSEKKVRIDAEGAGNDQQERHEKEMMIDPNGMFAYGWILNAKTRKVVWQMSVENTERNRRTRLNRKYEGQIKLPAGEYEIYYFSRKPERILGDEGFFSLGRLLDKLLRDENWFQEDSRSWHFRISNVDEVVSSATIEKYHKAIQKQAVISITDLSNSEFRQEGFTLEKPGSFEIYAVGEALKGETYDYGWITKSTEVDKIWEMLPGKGKYAGGANKNRTWRETIRLEPGDYWVYFITDDSHSPGNWNANPPYDPHFFGITISGVAGKFDPASVKELLKMQVEPVVNLTRLGNNEYAKEGFILKEPMKVRVYALGEGDEGEMYDYGWIENIDTGERVWSMTYDKTRAGGGAGKNRLVDQMITLPAGSYQVYFITDDSHSYPDWNSGHPYNPTAWGIAVYPADPKYTGERIEKLSQDEFNKHIISQIVRVQDGQQIQEHFTLKDAASVRVYAIGEGDWDEMYDYGWIENAKTDRKVWEMNFDKTHWAGGARKNRKVDEIINLPAGEYLLNFRTDDSHSYNNWNESPPDDPVHYGITLYRKGE
ncbi:MAG: hypothetical protein WAN36_00470 [Calditrichia bacterium]